MKHIVLGILAHVDAGKTTLTESVLYQSGYMKKLGRVDYGTTVLDYNQQEKERGITIFSKEARFQWKDCKYTLLDTPGHVDFSREMEKTLQVLDYAVLVVSALDGVQAHTETIWKLLHQYHIPTFLFVNKMDISYREKADLLEELKQRLHENCIAVEDANVYEQAALCNDELLEEYMETETITIASLQGAIANADIFPCFFGSALKLEGVDTLLNGISKYTKTLTYPSDFQAFVYNISRDAQGNRLTHMKITGGCLKVKQILKEGEKVDQIRCYSGNKYEMVSTLEAGQVCAVKGLQYVQMYEELGSQSSRKKLTQTSYLRYVLTLPPTCDHHKVFQQIQQLGEEDPSLQPVYHKETNEISMQFMGELQVEVYKELLMQRFGLAVDIGEGSIIYKETILEEVEGVGHYEPLRHYAEVHVLLEPLPIGSGLQFDNVCASAELEPHWQQLMMQHLHTEQFIGVLSGSLLTDMKITLLCGKGHPKHSEGPDFRQACNRAIRQGLKSTKSVLLEPYYQFVLEIEHQHVSRAIYDIERMHGTYEVVAKEDITQITGYAPVSFMRGYQKEVLSYTKGKGRFVCSMSGYRPCVMQEEVLANIGYDCDSDYDHPSGSIFCKQGAGYFVPWNEVRQHMHMQSAYDKRKKQSQDWQMASYQTSLDEETQLQQIFEKTYGVKKQHGLRKVEKTTQEPKEITPQKPVCILVDGYNVIHAWDELKDLLPNHMDSARQRCIDMVCSYKGYRNCEMILVFDAYHTDASLEKVYEQDGIYIVYTKKAQTADAYIERATKKLASEYQVSVVTSDSMEQLIAYGQGALRISSRTFIEEYKHMHQMKSKEVVLRQKRHRTYLLEDIRKYVEEDE